METDFEILARLLDQYLKSRSDEERLNILEDLEYLVHQFDNAISFIDMGKLICLSLFQICCYFCFPTFSLLCSHNCYVLLTLLIIYNCLYILKVSKMCKHLSMKSSLGQRDFASPLVHLFKFTYYSLLRDEHLLNFIKLIYI